MIDDEGKLYRRRTGGRHTGGGSEADWKEDVEEARGTLKVCVRETSWRHAAEGSGSDETWNKCFRVRV